jgi:DNA-binding response OmpR family regulator
MNEYDTRGLRVMVVENDRAIMEMIQIRLDVAGYSTTAVRTGRQALDMLRTFRPSALVIDLNLPDISGLEVLRSLNPRPQGAIPALITGRALSAAQVQEAVKYGARDCLAKPFAGADVLTRIQRMLKRPTPGLVAPPPVIDRQSAFV